MSVIDDPTAEQFALRWNNFSNNLSLGFSSCLKNKDLVDVTLAVEGQLVPAHKLILSICSSYFQDIFKNNPCQHPVVILKDMKFREIDALLQFMYQGEVSVKKEELNSFLKIAETLKIKGLTLENNSDSLKNTNGDNGNDDDSNESEQYCNGTKQEESSHNTKQSKKRNRNNISTRSSKRVRKLSSYANNVEQRNGPEEGELEDGGERWKREASPDENLGNVVKDEITKDDNQSDESIDLTKDDECNELPLPVEFVNNLKQPPNTDSVITYRLSSRGRPQLIHEGYVYNLTSRSEVLNRSHYRCAEQHRGCRGKCAVIAEQFMPTGVHEHNHSPGYRSEKHYKRKKPIESNEMD